MTRHLERHRSHHTGWLRVAVLGANDGLISTSSLVVGVAAAGTGRGAVLLAATAGLAAGALSMAAGEYVSVSSQADTEEADLARERTELATMPEFEQRELAAIYEGRGLSPELAKQVAEQLMVHDALGVHAREELGITDLTRARPLQAAIASAAAFAAGAATPVVLAAMVPTGRIGVAVMASTLVLLLVLGALAAKLGGAPPVRGALRVAFWGVAAMVATAGIGRLFGGTVP